MIDTGELVVRISIFIDKPVILAGDCRALLRSCVDAIRQLQEQIEVERKKAALLRDEIDDGR